MLVGGVIENEIDEDADTALIRLSDELVPIRERAVFGSDVDVIGDVVSEIEVRGGEEGRNPNCIHAEALQIIKARCDSVEITDAIAVGILEASRIDLVDHRAVIPAVPCLRRGQGSTGRNCETQEHGSHTRDATSGFAAGCRGSSGRAEYRERTLLRNGV